MSGNGNMRARTSYGPINVGALVVFVGALFGGLVGGCGEQARVGQSTPDGVHVAGWRETHGGALRSEHPTDLAKALETCDACHRDGVTSDAAEDEMPTCDGCHTPDADGCRTCHETMADSHAAHRATPEKLDAETCGLCHAVPATWRDADHLNDRGGADIVFSGRAAARDHHPTFENAQCTNVACHAGPGARTPAPVWGTKFAHPVCGSCHGLPPPAPHPAATRCQNCHSTVSPSGNRNLEDPHPNGKVVVDVLDDKECGDCHGNPPETGAHAAHLGATLGAPVACDTCHKVPEQVDVPDHLDDGVAGVEVVFGERAGPEARFAGGQCSNVTCHGADAPIWTGEAPCGSCHGTPPKDHPKGSCDRCHTNALTDGLPRDPAGHMDGAVDNRTLGAEDCALCHGAGAPVDPPAPHKAHARFDCGTCHVNPATPQAEGHLNGRVELRIQGLPARGGEEPAPGVVENGRCSVPTCHGDDRPLWAAREARFACDACHGNPPANHWPDMVPVIECARCHLMDPPNPAEPADRAALPHANGQVDLEFATECTDCHGAPPPSGAHERHARPRFSRPVPCQSCHVTPTVVTEAGHLDPPPVEVTLAAGRFDPATQTCTDVTCHAGSGNNGIPPVWTALPDSGAATCGACHGVPPPGHGPVDCVHCHGPSAGPGMTIANPDRHVNGALDRIGAAAVP